MPIPENRSLGFSDHTCRNSYDGWRNTEEENLALGEAWRTIRQANDKRAEANTLKDTTLRNEADEELAAARKYYDTLKAAYEARLDGPCSACLVSCTILRNGYG
jgi:hypothetical protein